MSPVRVGIIGTGWGANVQVPAFQCVDGLELVAITSGRKERAEAVAREHNLPYAFDDYREMLRAAKPDLISIVTPPIFHREMTLAALEAGVHVICEKPFAMNVAEGNEMVAAAARSGLITAVDHEFRLVPARLAMQRLLDEGAIGEPFLIRIADLTVRATDQPYGWWFDRAQGGGLFGAVGSHYIDAVHQWIGRFDRVSARLSAVIPERARADGTGLERVTADDTADLAFTLENGVAGHISLSITARGGARRTEIFGTAGTLILEGTKAFFTTGGPPEEVQSTLAEQGRLEDPRLGPTVELAQRVIDRINGHDSGPFATFADGLEVQRVMDAVRLSSDEGREVRIAEVG